ncbi:22309_t:CDS:1, partial [Gigaspora margarita]
ASAKYHKENNRNGDGWRKLSTWCCAEERLERELGSQLQNHKQ